MKITGVMTLSVTQILISDSIQRMIIKMVAVREEQTVLVAPGVEKMNIVILFDKIWSRKYFSSDGS